MKTIFVVALVLLAGAATSSQVECNWPAWVPDWFMCVPEWGININFPDDQPPWFPEINWSTVTLPELVDIGRDLVQYIPRVWEILNDILPGMVELVPPPWFPPTMPDNLPEMPNVPVADIINSLRPPVPGVPIGIQSYPSIVQIEYGIDSVWAQACAGALITNYHVLTSARCISGFHQALKHRRARCGATQRYGFGPVHEFGSFLVHPSYGNIQENFLDGDVGLGRLATAVVFSNVINTVQIVPQGYQIPENYPLVLAGWAGAAEGSTSFSNRDLHSIDLVATNKAACVNKWSQLAILSDRVKISDNMFCAGRPETQGRDAHLRDIGAPIYSYNILAGVLSFGHYFGDQDYPLVATSIASYTSWILANAV